MAKIDVTALPWVNDRLRISEYSRTLRWAGLNMRRASKGPEPRGKPRFPLILAQPNINELQLRAQCVSTSEVRPRSRLQSFPQRSERPHSTVPLSVGSAHYSFGSTGYPGVVALRAAPHN